MDYFKNIKETMGQFDEVTRFRLTLVALMSLLYAPIFPILTQYSYLMELNINNIFIPAATIIGLFAFIRTFSARYNEKILDKLTFSGIFKGLIIVDIITVFGLLTYFISPKLMVFIDSIVGIANAILMISYRTAVNNYMTYFHRQDYTRMQNFMIKIYSDSQSVGLILGALITFISVKFAIVFFSIGITSVVLWELKYVKRFEKYDFLYMLHYRRNLRKKKQTVKNNKEEK